MHGEPGSHQHPDDQPVLASLADYADEAEAAAAPATERAPEPIAEPVSKWTLVDPDAEAEELAKYGPFPSSSDFILMHWLLS